MMGGKSPINFTATDHTKSISKYTMEVFANVWSLISLLGVGGFAPERATLTSMLVLGMKAQRWQSLM